MNKKVNWGILGCAGIARVRTIPGLLRAGNAKLYAVASRESKKAYEFKALFGAEKAYESYDKLLEDESVEAVYIPLPNSMHYEWVEKAAKAGKHILCEKPLALNESDARKMYDICKQEGVILAEAFAYRHAPLVQKVKELINEEAVGNVKYIESHLTDVLTDMSNIRMNKALGGGAFYDMACYNVSVISYLLEKEPKGVKAFAEMNVKYGVDISNTFLLQYDDGVQAMGYSSLNSYSRGYYAVVGDKGRIEVPCNFNCRNICKFTAVAGGVVENVEILEERSTEYTIMCPDNYMLEIEQFGRSVCNGEKPLISEEETLMNIRTLDRIIQNAKS